MNRPQATARQLPAKTKATSLIFSDGFGKGGKDLGDFRVMTMMKMVMISIERTRDLRQRGMELAHHSKTT